METSRENRQFSLRLILAVMTAVAIVCAAWSFADRRIAEKARCDQQRREEARRRHDRALAEWEKHETPASWDFGP